MLSTMSSEMMTPSKPKKIISSSTTHCDLYHAEIYQTCNSYKSALDPLTTQKPAKENRHKAEKRHFSQKCSTTFDTSSRKTLFHIKVQLHLGLKPELEVTSMLMCVTKENKILICFLLLTGHEMF